jgi:ribonuclease G
MAVRVIREEFNQEYRKVVIDDRTLYEEVRDYVRTISPALEERVEFFDPTGESLPLLEKFHVHEQVHKALDRKVWLPSGGSLIIEHTEALTVIDVNTGKNVGRSSLEETVYRNNLEAAGEVARQLRLRDIGGIIVIDFIDMEIRKNRDDVIAKFRQALARDKTRTQVFDISELGLVEMTRKRTRESLAHMLCEPCEACQGKGTVKTARSVAYDILREILREARQFNPREYRVVAAPKVIELFLDEESQHLAGLSDFIGKPISLQSESAMGQEQYDIVLL